MMFWWKSNSRKLQEVEDKLDGVKKPETEEEKWSRLCNMIKTRIDYLENIALHAKNFSAGDEDGAVLSKLIAEYEKNYGALRGGGKD